MTPPSFPLVIAIDGPSGAGKGTLAARLARHFGFFHLDTGKLYRAAALMLREHALAVDDMDESGLKICAAEKKPAFDAFSRTLESFDWSVLSRPEIFSEETASDASTIARWPWLREQLLQVQTSLARHPPAGYRGAVMEGRDIATVICPDAPCKIFLSASVAVRAQRRYDELLDRTEGTGYAPSLERIARQIEQRDLKDRSRTIAPLRQAADAVLLEASALDREQVFKKALAIIRQTPLYAKVRDAFEDAERTNHEP